VAEASHLSLSEQISSSLESITSCHLQSQEHCQQLKLSLAGLEAQSKEVLEAVDEGRLAKQGELDWVLQGYNSKTQGDREAFEEVCRQTLTRLFEDLDQENTVRKQNDKQLLADVHEFLT